jgi:hypothetical protein
LLNHRIRCETTALSLGKNHSLRRFAREGTWKPNFEIKFPPVRTSHYSMEKKLPVLLNGKTLYTSEIEMQIAYKLYLTGDKDMEDAVYLYRIFKGKLNQVLLQNHTEDLKVPKERVDEFWKNIDN